MKIVNKNYDFLKIKDLYEFLFINGFISLNYINHILRERYRTIYNFISPIKLLMEEYIRDDELYIIDNIVLFKNKFIENKLIDRFNNFVEYSKPIFQVMRFVYSNPKYLNLDYKVVKNNKEFVLNDFFKKHLFLNKCYDYEGIKKYILLNSNYHFRKYIVNSLFVKKSELLNKMKFLANNKLESFNKKNLINLITNFDEEFSSIDLKSNKVVGIRKNLIRGDLIPNYKLKQIEIYDGEGLNV